MSGSGLCERSAGEFIEAAGPASRQNLCSGNTNPPQCLLSTSTSLPLAGSRRLSSNHAPPSLVGVPAGLRIRNAQPGATMPLPATTPGAAVRTTSLQRSVFRFSTL